MFSIADVTTALINRAGEIGLNYKIKGCDAFQLASALEGKADLLISTDNDLNTAAEEHGLTVWNPMNEPSPQIGVSPQEPTNGGDHVTHGT